MTRRPTVHRASLAAVTLFFSGAALAQAPARPELHVIENVRLAPDGEPVKLVLAQGRIEGQLPLDADNPPGARVIDGAGGLVVPAFVDAYGHAGMETPLPEADRDLPVPTRSDVRVDMRLANRRGVQPTFRVVDALLIEDKVAEAAREQGFATLCVAPSGCLLPGSSAVVTTRAAAPRDTVLVPAVFDHAELRPSDGGYPSTLMGCVAQLRQFFLDALLHRELTQRQASGRPGPRPPYDKDLAAILPVLDGQRRLVCHADSHRDIERWVKLSDEIGFELAITGGGEAWRVADVLAERDIPVVLTLDWAEEVDDPNAKKKGKGKGKGKPDGQGPDDLEGPGDPGDPGDPEHPQDPDAADEPGPGDDEGDDDEDEGEGDPDAAEASWEYTEPLAVRTERRRLWEETRDCALRLHESGVRFAFGSGDESAKQLLKHARALVEAGLPPEAALAAMTSGAAELLGLADQLGGLEPGMIASVAVWTDDPTAKDARLAWLFVEGFPHEFEIKEGEGQDGVPDEGVDATGTWIIEQEERGEDVTSTAVLEMTPEGEVTGTLTRSNPMDDGEIESALTGSVSGRTLTLRASLQFGDMDVSFSMKGELDGDVYTGDSIVKGPWGEMERPFEARREPDSGAEGTGDAEDLHAHPAASKGAR